MTADEGSYVPDFTAFIATESVRCIQIARADFVAAVVHARPPARGPAAGGLAGAGKVPFSSSLL